MCAFPANIYIRALGRIHAAGHVMGWRQLCISHPVSGVLVDKGEAVEVVLCRGTAAQLATGCR